MPLSNYASKISFAICAIIMLYASFVFYPRWQQSKTEAVLSWDVGGYYWYLPSIFIYKDIKKQKFKDSIIQKYEPSGAGNFQGGYLHTSGNYVMKYSSGMAIMYLPFFAMAHVLATSLGFVADGFSPPYQLAIQAGGLLIAIIGLWYLRKFLLIFYSEMVTAITLLLIVVGSNFLNYGAIDTGMPHCWLFTIYVFILHYTYRFYHRPTFKYALCLGLLCGLATLIRPTDIISALIPILWGLEGIGQNAIKKQFNYLKVNLRYLIVACIVAALVFSIQLVYWKYSTGDWIVYSYQDQGFTWLQPHFKEYLVGAHNGWLAYAPIMSFSIFGLIPFWLREKQKIAIALFVLVDLYIVVCWGFYWYGGRFMIQAYPILILPFASFIEWMLEHKIAKIIFIPILILCTYIGLWTNIHYHYGNLYDFETGNRAYYLATIGRWHLPENIQKLRDTDELYENEPKKIELIYYSGFENDTSTSSLPPINGKKSICLNEQNANYELIIPYAKKDKEWIRTEANFHCVLKEWNVWAMTQFIVSFLDNGEVIKTKMIRVYRFLNDGDTKRLYIDTKIPQEHFNEIKVAFWHCTSKQTLLVDDLKVSAFEGQ